MKLLFINQYYWPDNAATAQMLSDLCEHLARQGHDVHVLCSRGKYDHGTATGRRQPRYESHHGVHIHRITATGFGKRNMAGRVIDYFSFHVLLGLRTIFTGWRYDALITLTTPPLVGIYATLVKTLTRTKHVCWVMDLHPDCEFELGVFDRRKMLPRMLDWLNSTHFRRASHNVVLGTHMAKRLTDKGVAASRVSDIPVWGHEAQGTVVADPAGVPMRQALGLQDKFVIMYSGNAGLIHSFDEICQAALTLRDEPRFVFLFVGGGRRKAMVEEFAREHELPNMRFYDYFPREQLGQSLSMANVHLITLRQGMAGVAVPSKLYGIMAAGRPAVFIGPERCESADAINRTGAGHTIALGDVEGLIRVLRRLADDPDHAATLGRHARAAFDAHYCPQVCCPRWSELLHTVVTG